MTRPWIVFGCKGCGNVIAEVALAIAGVPYEREEVDYDVPGPARDRLVALNPLCQVPAIVLPDGSVMTETAAVVLHLDELAPDAGLLPRVGDPRRRDALRWLVVFVAAVYPTFTYGDDPAKWTTTEGADALKRSTDTRREELWRQLEAAAGAPWFLGGTAMTALDVYVAVMSRWRPRRDWFRANAPKLHAIALAADRDPRLAPIVAAHY